VRVVGERPLERSEDGIVELPAMDEAETQKYIDTGEKTEAQELIESEEVADADE